MAISQDAVGQVNLSGNMQLADTKTLSVTSGQGHVQNIGRMLEENELTLRNKIEGNYIQKTREITHGIRNPDQEKRKAWAEMVKTLQS